MTRIVIKNTSISMARYMKAGKRGCSKVFNECNLPKSLSGETPLTDASSNSNHERDVDDAESYETLSARVKAALGLINEKDARVLKLKHLDDITVAEIAKQFNTSDDAIHARVRRGSRAIREYMDDICAGIFGDEDSATDES